MSVPAWIGIECAAAVIIALFVRRFVCVIVWVKGTSMRDTLMDGEMILARRYVRTLPKRGDIVICRFAGAKRLYLKRVIGLPGETVSFEDGQVLIDGRVIEEPYLTRKGLRKSEPSTLDANTYFLMGDNRPVSRDSRKLGGVQAKDILGRCVYVFYPFRRRRHLRQIDTYQTLPGDR